VIVVLGLDISPRVLSFPAPVRRLTSSAFDPFCSPTPLRYSFSSLGPTASAASWHFHGFQPASTRSSLPALPSPPLVSWTTSPLNPSFWRHRTFLFFYVSYGNCDADGLLPFPVYLLLTRRSDETSFFLSFLLWRWNATSIFFEGLSLCSARCSCLLVAPSQICGIPRVPRGRFRFPALFIPAEKPAFLSTFPPSPLPLASSPLRGEMPSFEVRSDEPVSMHLLR